MKRISKYLLVFVTLLLATENFAQRIEIDKERYVFWFYVRAEIKQDKITRVPRYTVRILSKKPKSGTLQQFDKDLWRNLNGGQNLVIGPFLDYHAAVRAIKVYDLARPQKKGRVAPMYKDTISGNPTYYYFALKFKISKRKHRFEFQHMPARIDGGDLTRFQTFLRESLTQTIMAIGPFPSEPEAEESKFRYRIEEN